MPPKPLAYSYIRMSTELQLKGDSLRRQLEASEAYAEAKGLDLLDEHRLQDIGISAYKGANVSEGALGRFLQAAEIGKVPRGSYLLVESLDRISRQEPRKSLAIFLNIIEAGINIVTLTDQRTYTAESTDEMDLFQSIFIMSRAHEESQTKSRRVKAAWAHKRTNAKSAPLTAICPYWIKISDDRTTFELIEDRAAIVRRIFDESAAGLGKHKIAERLNKHKVPVFGKSKRGWQPSYIAKILKNRSAIGEYQPHTTATGRRVAAGDPVKGYFPSVIDPQTFYAVQSGLAERTIRGAGRKGRSYTNLFSGLLSCSYCKSRMKFENKGPAPKGGNFLVCDGAKRGMGCEAVRWRYEDFEASFIAFVREIDLAQLIDNKSEAQKLEKLDLEIASLKGRKATVEENREKTYELYLVSGDAPAFVAQKLREYDDELLAIDEVLAKRDADRVAMSTVMGSRYASKAEINALISNLQNYSEDEGYKVRAMLASRIRLLTKQILVAPSGNIPTLRKFIAILKKHEGVTNYVDYFEKKHFEEEQSNRYFVVSFADGAVRTVYPDRRDPTKVDHQFLNGENGWNWIGPDGDEKDVFAGLSSQEQTEIMRLREVFPGLIHFAQQIA